MRDHSEPRLDALWGPLSTTRFVVRAGWLALALSILVLVSTLLFIVHDRDRTRAEAEGQLQAAAEVAADRTRAALNEAAYLAQWLTDRVARRTWSDLTTDEAFWRSVREQIGYFPAVESVWIVDAEAALRFTSFAFPPPAVTTDRPLYQVDREAPSHRYVSAPFVGAVSGAPVINVSNLVTTAGGARGVLGISLDVAAVSAILQQADRLHEGAITIRRADGAEVVFRYPDLWSPHPFETAPARADYLIAGVALGDWPLTLEIGLPHATVLAPWRPVAAVVGGLGIVASLALFAVFGISVRVAVRQDEALIEARAAVRAMVNDVAHRTDMMAFLSAQEKPRRPVPPPIPRQDGPSPPG